MPEFRPEGVADGGVVWKRGVVVSGRVVFATRQSVAKRKIGDCIPKLSLGTSEIVNNYDRPVYCRMRRQDRIPTRYWNSYGIRTIR